MRAGPGWHYVPGLKEVEFRETNPREIILPLPPWWWSVNARALDPFAPAILSWGWILGGVEREPRMVSIPEKAKILHGIV